MSFTIEQYKILRQPEEVTHITVMNKARLPVTFAYTWFIPGSGDSPGQLSFMH